MKRWVPGLLVVLAAGVILAGLAYYFIPEFPGSPVPPGIRLPPGFSLAVYADTVPGARSMTAGPPGVVFVGTRGEGKVYAVLDTDQDQKADRTLTIASGLDSPNGVAYRDGSLYVAEVSRILRFDHIGEDPERPSPPVVVRDDLPTDRTHGWKFIAFGPDGRLYVPVGAPCNVCEGADPRHAAILRMDPDGSNLEMFARGIRNTVGFDWDPDTGDLWFTDNGRDWMGEDLPPDELNHAPVPGLHFGFPFCHGTGIPDPEFNRGRDCTGYTPPAQGLPAHVAALGMRFYTGEMFPDEYHGQIFIAEHGSWNRVVPTGYRISLVRLDHGIPVSYEVFADGWLEGRAVSGRPVDLLVMPDGALLVSDDHAGKIYRIAYGTGQQG